MKFLKRQLFVALTVAVSQQAMGTIIFVDGQLSGDCNGNYSISNRNDAGSDGIAYNTPQEAADVVQPGDTVYFRQGTYKTISGPRTAAAYPVLEILQSGTVDHPITFKSYNNEEVIFSAENSSGEPYKYYAIRAGVKPSDQQDASGAGVQNMIIEGLTVTNATRAGLAVCGPANRVGPIANPTDNITVRYCVARDNTCPINTYSKGIITYGRVENSTIEYCTAYNNTGNGISLHWVGKVWHLIEDYDDMSAARNCVVRNCLSYDNIHPTSPGDTDGMTAAYAYQCTVENNVIFNNSDDGLDVYASAGCIVKDNLVFGHPSDPRGNGCGIKFVAGGGGLHTIRRNITFDNDAYNFEGSKSTQEYTQWMPSRVYNNIAMNGLAGFLWGYDYNSPPEGWEIPYLRNNLSINLPNHDFYANRAYWDGTTDSDHNYMSRSSNLDDLHGIGQGMHSLTGSDPGYASGYTGGSLSIDTTFQDEWAIEVKLEHIRGQLRSALSLTAGSSCVDAGTVIPGYHNPAPGANGGDGAVWYGAAPDIGVFEYVPDNQISAYVLSVSSTVGGSVTNPGTESYPYSDGTVVSLQATADDGHYFVNWTGTAVNSGKVVNPSTASTTLVVDADYTIHANFTLEQPKNLVISSTPGGTVTTPGEGTDAYEHGTVVSVVATPAANYHFVSWTGGAATAGQVANSSSASTTVTVDADYTLVANFLANNGAPVLSAIGPQRVDENSELSFNITATDPDGDDLVYSIQYPPAGFTFGGSSFSWTPGYDQAGSYSEVTFTVSDGSLTDSERITITVNDVSQGGGTDVTSPTVADLSPAADGIQAPLNSVVGMAVSDAGQGVDSSTVAIRVNSQLVYAGDTALYDSAYGICIRSGTAASYDYLYLSTSLYDHEEEVTVTVNASDLAGNAMSPYNYSYFTEMRLFGSNCSLSQDGLASAHPAMVTDSQDDMWIAWHSGSAGARDIYVGQYDAVSHQLEVTTQVTSNASDQWRPALAVGTDNRLYMAWQDNRLGDWDIYLSTSADGTHWSVPLKISDSNDNQVSPAIAVTGSTPNTVYVAWQDGRGVSQDIYVASSNTLFATATVTQVTNLASDQTEPIMAAGGNNVAYVAWTDTRNGAADVYAASSGNSWSNVPVVTGAGSQSSPALAVAATECHWLWVDHTPGYADIYYGQSSGMPGTAISGSSILDETDVNPSVPRIVAGNSRVFACWADNRSAIDSDLCFAEIRSGSAGTNVLVGDDGANSEQMEPAFGLSGQGEPFLVWTDDRDVDTRIYCSGSVHMDSTAMISGAAQASQAVRIGTDPAAVDSLDDVSIQIPAGACSSHITIGIHQIENAPAFSSSVLAGYEFSPSGLQFSEPVVVSIPFDPGSSDARTPYWFNPSTGSLSSQGITDISHTVISDSLHVLTFKTTHFSTYYVLGGSASGSGGGGGGGCSMSQGRGTEGAVEYFLPFGVLAMFVALQRRRERRAKLEGQIRG